MRKAIYPGSFDPWHKGHEDILSKALKVFDSVFIIQLVNPSKAHSPEKHSKFDLKMSELKKIYPNIDYVSGAQITLKEAVILNDANAVIRGLRDGYDLAYERSYQYWNEDLGVEVPFAYFVADRLLNHVSSSTIRQLEGIGLKHNY